MPNQWEQPNAWAMPDDIQKLLELRERALQQQQQQEQPTSTDFVNAEVMQGINARRDPANQQAQMQAQIQPQQQPYLNPQTAYLLEQLVNNKDAYEHADIYALANNPNEKDKAVLEAAANDIRTTAHAGNDRIRELAKAINLDLNGYENVGYEDAYNTLQDRKAKEIAELMDNAGRYSVSTDQFYNDNYLALIGEGKSAREAKRIAGRLAQEYQADRVTYLRNAYNVYGRDGNYTNDIGVGILDAIAQENPEVAKVYATAYKIPKEAQNRYEQVEDAHLQHWLGQQDMALQGLINAGLAEQTFGFNTQLKHLDSKLHRDEYVWEKDVDFNDAMRRYKFKTEEEKKAKFQTYRDTIAICTSLGMPEKDAKICALASIGIQIPKNGQEADAKTVENLTKIYEVLDKTEKNLLTELEGKDGIPVDDKRAADIEAKISLIRAQKESLLGLATAKLGITELGKQPEELTSVNEFSPDDAVNNRSLAQLWQLSKGNFDTFKGYVSKWLDASGITPRFKKQYLENLKAPQ